MFAARPVGLILSAERVKPALLAAIGAAPAPSNDLAAHTEREYRPRLQVRQA